MKIALRIFLCLLALENSWAAEIRFDSGFPKLISERILTRGLESSEAVQEFLEKEFSKIAPLEWKLSKKQEDNTHIHLTFDLFFENYPVFFQHLKIHWNKAGFIDYVTNTLRKSIEVPARAERVSWEDLREPLTQVLYKKTRFQGSSRGTLGLWLNEEQSQATWAYDIQTVPERGGVLKRGIVSIENRELLEEKKVIRHWEERADVSLKVFKSFPRTTDLSDWVNPFPTQNSNVTNGLKDEVSWVRYDRVYETDPDPKVKITQVYEETGGGTSTITGATVASTSYQTACDKNQTNCPNQKLDAGSVFYHLKNYRSWLGAHAASLNASLAFAYDPIPTIVNFMGFSILKDKNENEIPPDEQANNAAYIGAPCAEDGSMQRCLVFLRPAESPCFENGPPKEWFSLAREALVIAHEYQHYVTDMISGIEFGSEGGITVGDVIHEGYSDYFGASYVTQNDPGKTDTYVVGAYGFQNCGDLQRDLSQKKIFSQDQAYTSAHRPGWVWASALWELRTPLGIETVDKIALKSLYFLSTSPGFIDSIEAIIHADKSITGGQNETRIRTLFYDDRKFIGSLSDAFQDSEKKILKVGFQGCAHVERSQDASFKMSLAVVFLWLVGTLALPKLRRSLKEPT